MGKLLAAFLILVMPYFAYSANQCIRLFQDSPKPHYNAFDVDSSNMSSVDYLLLQHRRWQQIHKVEYYSKEQLHQFVAQARAGDQRAMEALIISNIPFVIQNVARKVSRQNSIFPELVNQVLVDIYPLVHKNYRLEDPNASFLQALHKVIKNVLKNHRKDDEVIDYGVKYYNETKNFFGPLKDKYESQGLRLTPEVVVQEYNSRYTEKISLNKAKQILLHGKLNTVRENTETSTGFSLESLKARPSLDIVSSLSEINYVHKLIDHIKAEIKSQVFETNRSKKATQGQLERDAQNRVEIFELFYGLTKEGFVSREDIANKLGLTLRNVRWILTEKIRLIVQSTFNDKGLDRDLVEQGFLSYSQRNSEQKVNESSLKNITPDLTQQSAKALESQLDLLHKEFLESKPPLDTVRELRNLETAILKSKNQDLIFELNYFMAEILLEAKKYDLAAQKAEELLKTGKDWNESHKYYQMLHHIAGKSAYHTGNYRTSNAHMRRALVINGPPYETWFYLAKSTEQLNSSTNFETSFQKFILNMTTLHRLFREDQQTLTTKQLDHLKTVEHLSEVGLSEASRILKNAHGFNSITSEAVRSYTEAIQKNDHIGIIKALQPMFESLIQTPKKRLKKLNLEGPTAKAFHIFLIDLAKSFKATGQIQQFEKVVRFLEEL